MASEVHLAAGHLRSAAEYADRLGGLACYRDYPHPAIARRIKVDALAGDLEAAVARGDRFLAAWERAGRPISGTLNVTAYADGDGAWPARRRGEPRTMGRHHRTLMLDPGAWRPVRAAGPRPSTHWSRWTAINRTWPWSA